MKAYMLFINHSGPNFPIAISFHPSLPTFSINYTKESSRIILQSGVPRLLEKRNSIAASRQRMVILDSDTLKKEY